MADRDRVIVAGAGPVGLFAALRLAQAGIEVIVFEANPAISTAPRALGHQWPSPKLFAAAGILEEATKVGVVKDTLQLRRLSTGAFDEMSLKALGPDTDGIVPYDIYLGQHVLADIVLRHLNELPGTEVRWNARVTGVTQDDDGVRVTVETEDGPADVRGGWLVGADGSHSAVRPALGLGFEGFTWPDRFVASNVRYDFEKYHGFAEGTFLRDPVNWGVIIKINNDRLWRVTYAEDPDLPEEKIRERVDEHYHGIVPGMGPYELEAINSYRVHERCADTFRVGRVLLAGDAAHVNNPCGGIGLMGGLFDANAVAYALSARFAGQEGEKELERYAEERRRIWREYTSPTASEMKRNLSESDPEKMAQDDREIHHALTDPDILPNAVAFASGVVGTFPISWEGVAVR